MKIKTLAMIVVSALSLSSTAALADTTTVNGGTVHFKGEVVNAACAVDAGSIDQTVQLGQVRSAKLATAGSTSSAVGFNIQLDDCDTTVATKASVAFAGTAIDSSNTTVLALQNSAAGSATNVGVQILDNTGWRCNVLCDEYCDVLDNPVSNAYLSLFQPVHSRRRDAAYGGECA
ncbi:type 1 fimbriae major subunit FimA [Klebsiella pneumoniae]|nr:type 1 fimbriae major subunit FimA [Klebsiella pneumoniae]